MGTDAEIAGHDVSGKLLDCPLTAELRQAGTSRMLRIRPKGTRDIRGERDHSGSLRKFLVSAGLLFGWSVVVSCGFASADVPGKLFDRDGAR